MMEKCPYFTGGICSTSTKNEEVFYNETETAAGVLADAFNILLVGPFKLIETSNYYDSISNGDKTKYKEYT